MLQFGDVTINEFMANPSGSDRYNEWLELKNNTDEDIVIDNLKVIRDNSSYKLNEKNLVIKANSYFLIAKSPNSYLVNYDAIISNLSLTNSGTRRLKLMLNDVIVDELTYSGSKSGVSLQYNNEWCKSRSVISSTNSDKGTPGSENISCSDVCFHNCSSHGVCNDIDGSCECVIGYKGETCNECQIGYEQNGSLCDEVLSELLNERDIIISEFMPNPIGDDENKEWIEIYNRTDKNLSLNGLKIVTDTDSYDLADGYIINANSYFVIAQSSSAANASVDAVLSSMNFENIGEYIIVLELVDFTLDIISYTDSIEGKSKQLDKEKYEDEYEDSNWCEKTAYPGVENPACNEVNYCENINCNNGECINGESSYTCLCQIGYSGDNCLTCDTGNPDCSNVPEAKSLVITELMINPDGSDNLGEWIEIYNNTNNKLKLENVKIQKDDMVYDVVLTNNTVNANSYYLISRNMDMESVDATATINLNNVGLHTISLIVNGTVIDTVTYDGSYPSKSFQLDMAFLDADNNDDLNNWCNGGLEIHNLIDKGTPRAQNTGCGGCAAIECPLNGHCEMTGETAECFCEAGYELDAELEICVMTQQCGILYDGVRNLSGDELKLALQQLTGQRFNAVKYSDSKEVMYRKIDIDYNNQVQCVYTGRRMTIVEGEPLDSRNGNCNIWSCHCGNPGMNTEHTWPQSKFDKEEPMKGDVHHLFPADACTNSRRSSYKFGVVSSMSGLFGNDVYGYSKFGNDTDGDIVFEPADVTKGDIARGMFYFITRYGNYSNFLDDKQEAILRQWAIDDPVSDKERLRNTKIERLQWNRNPYVDCPQLLELIPDF